MFVGDRLGLVDLESDVSNEPSACNSSINSSQSSRCGTVCVAVCVGLTVASLYMYWSAVYVWCPPVHVRCSASEEDSEGYSSSDSAGDSGDRFQAFSTPSFLNRYIYS